MRTYKTMLLVCFVRRGERVMRRAIFLIQALYIRNSPIYSTLYFFVTLVIKGQQYGSQLIFNEDVIVPNGRYIVRGFLCFFPFHVIETYMQISRYIIQPIRKASDFKSIR